MKADCVDSTEVDSERSESVVGFHEQVFGDEARQNYSKDRSRSLLRTDFLAHFVLESY